MNLHNQKGSALVLLLTLIPLFLTLLIGSSIVLHLLGLKSSISRACHQSAEKKQFLAAQAIDSLLKLNAQATVLRTQKKIKEIQLALALPRLPASATEVALLKVQLKKIKNEQILLGRLQNKIQQQGQTQLDLGKRQLLKELDDIFIQFQSDRPWLKITNQVHSLRLPRLGVHPTDTELAPTYEINPHLENDQSLAAHWQIEISLNNDIGFVPKKIWSLEASCSTTLLQKDQKWIIKNREDKSLSSVFSSSFF